MNISGIWRDDLEAVRQIYPNGKFIGFTLNVPRTKPWMRLMHSEQERLLLILLRDGIRLCKLPYILRYNYVYERSKDGTPHMHGLLSLPQTVSEIDSYYLLTDLYKMVHQRMITTRVFKKIKYIQPNYNDDYKRSYGPLMTNQFMKDTDEYIRWITYCRKYQPSPSQSGSARAHPPGS